MLEQCINDMLAKKKQQYSLRLYIILIFGPAATATAQRMWFEQRIPETIEEYCMYGI